MRVKKQKRHRRAVRFYTACFGFREPFKILCDGTFVHHLLANGITPADTALANTLGATVKIFTTRSPAVYQYVAFSSLFHIPVGEKFLHTPSLLVGQMVYSFGK